MVGVSCGFDTIAASTPLPAGIAAGDLLAFLATGAYEETLAGNFNSMPRPASVLVRGRLGRADPPPRDAGRPARPRAHAARPAARPHRASPASTTSRSTVADLDRSLEFYGGVLGLRVLDRGPLDPELVARMTGLPDADVEYADVELGDAHPGAALPPHARSARPALAARPERPGSVHIALDGRRRRGVHDRLTEPAASRRCRPPQTLPDDGSDWAGCVIFYVRDPDGVMLEIVERSAAASRTPSAPVPVSDPARWMVDSAGSVALGEGRGRSRRGTTAGPAE